jgi:uncharacterized protein (TIGR03083 family)
MVTNVYLRAASAVGALLRSPALPARWSGPSALAEFRVSGLAGHLARGLFTVESYLDAAVPPGAAVIDAVAYFGSVLDDTTDVSTAANQAVRTRGEQDAGDGPTDLADRYDAALARLADRLPGLSDDLPVLTAGRFVLPLRECLVTRLVELLVHADDLAVSLDVPAPAFPPEATDLVVSALACFAVRRHGGTAVLRTLARRERATGPVAAF